MGGGPLKLGGDERDENEEWYCRGKDELGEIVEVGESLRIHMEVFPWLRRETV